MFKYTRQKYRNGYKDWTSMENTVGTLQGQRFWELIKWIIITLNDSPTLKDNNLWTLLECTS